MAERRIYPPVYFLLAILTMFGLHWVAPVAAWIGNPWRMFGGVFVLLGMAIMVVAAKLFHKHETTIKPFEESSALVLSGPYRFSRNPMYLAMVIILFGIAVLLGTLTPLFVIPVFAWLITSQFLVREEEDLAKRFGEQYLDYTSRVRRWL